MVVDDCMQQLVGSEDCMLACTAHAGPGNQWHFGENERDSVEPQNMLHEIATAVSNLPWWRRRAWRRGRAAGNQDGVLDETNETRLHVLRQL